jgi:opacity protein-like surface antigen
MGWEKMKRIKTVAILAAVFLLFPSFSSGFSLYLRLSPGLSWLKAAEVNQALAGWQEGWRRQAEVFPNISLANQNVGSLHFGIDFEAELLFSFSRWLGLSVSAGYTYASLDEKQTLISVTRDGILTNYARPTQVSAYPIILSAYVFLPLSQKFNAYVRGGLGTTLATYVVREANKKVEAPRFAYPVYDNAKARGRSYLGSLGLSYALDQSFGFFIEATVRSAKLSGFEGEDKQGVKGRLYAYEGYRGDIGFWQPRMSLHPEKPEGVSVRNVREATVDFSGYSAKIGLFLKF